MQARFNNQVRGHRSLQQMAEERMLMDQERIRTFRALESKEARGPVPRVPRDEWCMVMKLGEGAQGAVWEMRLKANDDAAKPFTVKVCLTQ